MAALPRPVVGVHGEDVEVEVPGLLRVSATFLSEGLFDEEADGDPDEEDLYEVEVTHEEGSLLETITFPRLMPATAPAWDEDDGLPSERPPAEKFSLALAWQLAHSDVSNWDAVCEGARVWDSWMVEDVLNQIPPEWTPVELEPDLD